MCIPAYYVHNIFMQKWKDECMEYLVLYSIFPPSYMLTFYWNVIYKILVVCKGLDAIFLGPGSVYELSVGGLSIYIGIQCFLGCFSALLAEIILFILMMLNIETWATQMRSICSGTEWQPVSERLQCLPLQCILKKKCLESQAVQK